MSRITVARAGPSDLADVRAMLEEYAAWLQVDLCFQGFTRELESLPGDYAPPGGDLFIARIAKAAAGMIAFRAAASSLFSVSSVDRSSVSSVSSVDRSSLSSVATAEMKRLYVRPSARGEGLGRLLVTHVIQAARQAGYTRMILDTLPVMRDAQRLYEEFGFRDIEAYYESPVAGTRYMALDLTKHSE